MKKTQPSLAPQSIDKRNWYYEDKNSIEIIHEVYVEGTYLRTDSIKIPLKMLRQTLNRLVYCKK
jgi:hypothetical protein